LSSIKNFLFTNDVETTSLVNHCLSDKTGEKVLKDGMPVLLELYHKYNVKSTFFFTGHIAEKYPEIVSMIIPFGHEVACHGMLHDSNKAFDVLSLDEQVEHLKKAKNILESISNQEVISFRAPALRVNKDTPIALEKTGFLIDSSISPQRFDMFFSFGIKDKLKWLNAPRKPYFTSQNDLSKRGNFSIFEIPINAYLLPYFGTLMRISPLATRIVRQLVNFESNITNNIPNFLIHPNELIDEKSEISKVTRRSNNLFGYLVADKLRHFLKLRNLGAQAIPIFEDQINFFSKKNFQFIRLKDLYTILNNQII
jgi:peptidoglycan-N-acetylglucosamine deacetylase